MSRIVEIGRVQLTGGIFERDALRKFHREGAKKGMREAMKVLRKEVKKRTPVADKKRYATAGTTRKSMTFRVHDEGLIRGGIPDRIIGSVGSDKFWSVWLETGAKNRPRRRMIGGALDERGEEAESILRQYVTEFLNGI